MSQFKVGILGAGKPWKAEGATGFGMNHAHAQGYAASGKCEIVAIADPIAENAQEFSEKHTGGKARLYGGYEELLAAEPVDMVSIATWPHLHAPMVIAAAKAGVRAIHCEKPMAGTFGDAKAMAAACAEAGAQLSFNHQRRFNNTFQTARKMLDDGAIGDIVRIEGACGNFLDWGTHWMNMYLFYLRDEAKPLWVIGQVDARHPNKAFDVPHDTQGMGTVRFDNGVMATLWTGDQAHEMVGCEHRIFGTDGWMEIHGNAPHIRWRGKGHATTQIVEGEATEGGLHGNDANIKNVCDAVDALETGRKPLCDVSNALPTTEILFGIYESARHRGRIDLPLTIEDHPLVDMIASGVFPGAQ
ncbi:MAG: Gfo/Idh/MocA family oxidoreductase [Armatimonas sp.]